MTAAPLPPAFVVVGRPTDTNLALADAGRHLGAEAAVVGPEEAERRLGRGDVALARLDVLPTVDGVEPGFWHLRRLAHRGTRVVNRPGALLAAHDKLATAVRLAQAGLPHPATAHVNGKRTAAQPNPPVVVKPRFGSWGRDVHLCESERELEECLRVLRERSWFRRHGALVQELVPPQGRDLRIVVAAGAVVGAIERVARPGEWRTNVTLGAVRRPVDPPAEARALAVAASAALGTDLVGVDLLSAPGGGYVVLELNGAVDFTRAYSLDGRDVFDLAAARLSVGERAAAGRHEVEVAGV